MGVFEYGELNGSIHFHALIYIPEGEVIGELVKKREYSTKRGERRTRYGNTFFDEYFGMSDFQEVNPVLLKRGGYRISTHSDQNPPGGGSRRRRGRPKKKYWRR